MKTKTFLFTLAIAFPAISSLAQGQGRQPGPPPDGQRPPRGPQEPGDHPPAPMPPPPLLHALDADDDGIISADEIKNAPAALAKLDKNGDKQLTADELRPPPPDGPPPKDGRKDGQRGEKKGDGDRPQKKAEGDKSEKKPADWPFAKDKTGKSDQSENAAKPEGDRSGQGDKPQGPPPPLIGALDADHDGVISEEEIAKSSESLLKLDKNGDGQLGPREYGMPPHPPGPPPKDGQKEGEQKPAQ